MHGVRHGGIKSSTVMQAGPGATAPNIQGGVIMVTEGGICRLEHSSIVNASTSLRFEECQLDDSCQSPYSNLGSGIDFIRGACIYIAGGSSVLELDSTLLSGCTTIATPLHSTFHSSFRHFDVYLVGRRPTSTEHVQ